MATRPGFPWQAPATDPEKEEVMIPVFTKAHHLDEKKQDKIPASPVKTTLSHQQQQSRKHSNSLHWHYRGSIKGPPRVNLSEPSHPPDSINSKPTSPLPVRTIPAWVRDAEEDDLDDPQFQVLDAPNAALVAHHHHSPATVRQSPRAGKQQYLNGLYVTGSRGHPQRVSRWKSFGQPSAYPRENFDTEKVDADWLNHNLTDYSKPWLADHEEDDDEESSSRYRAFRRKRQAWYKRAQFTIMRNPFIPLAFRLTVLTFAVAAMILGASIFHESGIITRCIQESPDQRSNECKARVGDTATDYYRDPSGLMAVIVDAIAIIYTLYITYDEYFSKPLGLRRARAKVRLVLLDLFFVVFQSANLALSFESLTVDEGACRKGDTPGTYARFDKLCERAESLSAVLLISLFAWLLTFSVSVLRLVERIETK